VSDTTANSFMIREWSSGIKDEQRIKIIELFECVELDRNKRRQLNCSQLEQIQSMQKQIDILTKVCEDTIKDFDYPAVHDNVYIGQIIGLLKQALKQSKEVGNN